MAASRPRTRRMGEPFRINIQGAPGNITFPKVCPNCAGTAVEKLKIERAFCLEGEDTNSWLVLRATPLFCPACIAQHWLEAKPVSAPGRLALALETEMTIAMLGPFLFGGFLVLRGLEDYARHGDAVRSGVLIGAGSVFLLIALGCLMGGFSKTAHKAITPPTSITSAVDFTSDQSSVFEPAWHKYTFRNTAYGEAFAAVNHNRLCDGRGEAARRAANWRFNFQILAHIAVAAAVVYYIYDEFAA